MKWRAEGRGGGGKSPQTCVKIAVVWHIGMEYLLWDFGKDRIITIRTSSKAGRELVGRGLWGYHGSDCATFWLKLSRWLKWMPLPFCRSLSALWPRLQVQLAHSIHPITEVCLFVLNYDYDYYFHKGNLLENGQNDRQNRWGRVEWIDLLVSRHHS